MVFKKDWFDNDFHHGDLTEEVYMVKPPVFELTPYHLIILACKLQKALYGLRQFWAWFEKLKSFLIHTFFFTVSIGDHWLFIKFDKDLFALLLVYVNDILITGTSEAMVESVINSINVNFKHMVPRTLNYFLAWKSP